MKDLQFTRVCSKNSVSKLIGLFFLLFVCAQPLFSANVLGRPRKMFLIKTEHFDVIFSSESEQTALLLTENADNLYKKAAEALGSKNNLHMPVIISPDSDVLSVSYTPSPYNRIIIFDSPSDYQTSVFEDTMLGLFYREIYKALAQSIRSPFNQFVAKWVAGEAYQPVQLFNLPYSFVEGIAYIAESENPDEGRLNDGYFLQILAQAKLDKKFPKWSQVTTVRDIYPYDEIVHAAGAGFSAFLMNVYGVEKYAELWQECGKLHPFMTQGIFLKVYGVTLADLWKEFEASVPLPAGLESMTGAEFSGEDKLVFPKDKEANYEHILLTDYGIVWYDRIRHEVDVYDEKGVLKIRQLLFLADNIERMSLSPDGRYIAVSHTQARTMEGLSSSSTSIYDLKQRKFLDVEYLLRDASIVMTFGRSYAVAGVNVKDALPKLEIYTMPLDDDEGELIFEKKFERNKTPFSPVFAGPGEIAYILADGTKRFLCRLDFKTHLDKKDDELEQKFIIEADGKPLKIQQLSYIPSRGGSAPFYTFNFTLPHEHSFTRAGFIQLSEDFQFQNIQLTLTDVSGGYNYPVLSPDGKLFYSAKKFSVNQMRTVPFTSVPVMDSAVRAIDSAEVAGELQVDGKNIDFTSVRRYNPLRYMADFSFMPLFPIKTLDLSEGNLYWPGLGLTIESQTDPCMNTQAALSAGWTYLPMDFSWTSNIPSSYLSKIRTESLNMSKDKSVGIFIENSSTPVYIKAGSLLNFNLNGEYNFKLAAGGQWKLPVGIALRHFTFDVQASYTVSTDYYDQTQRDIRPSLSQWPSFEDAYEMYEISAIIEYTNIHQYGYSTFEQRGLSIGMRAYSMWDMYEVKLLQQAREELEEEEKLQQQQNQTQQASSDSDDESAEENLTNAQKKNLVSESIADITQLNAGFFATVAIPRLTPLTAVNGWVLSVPALISAEFMNKAGTALESRAQILLIGREIHNNVIPAFLYCRRAGLWVGYDMGLVYDTTEVRLPDIRHENYLAEVFSDVSYTQAVYLVLNLDLNITTGKLSTIPINTTLTGTFFPESHGYDISLDVRLHL